MRSSPIVFDQRLHISPFELFRALSEGHPLTLVDVRPLPARLTLRGAVRLREDGDLPPGSDFVLFDDDGSLAERHAHGLTGPGPSRCRALYGGLLVYELAIVPEVVGGQTFLSPLPS